MNDDVNEYQQRLNTINERVAKARAILVPWCDRWDKESESATKTPIGARLLKSQGSIARDILDGRDGRRLPLQLAALALGACALYGAVIGSFSGAEQALFAAIKFPLVILGSAIICLPSLYVFQCLSGSQLTFSQAATTSFLMSAASGLILFGCAPIAWFFTISTEPGAWRFIALLHVAMVAAAVLFGINLVSRLRRYSEWKQSRILSGRITNVWNILFIVVALQMSYFIGPLMIGEGAFMRGERGLFTKLIGDFFALDAGAEHDGID